MFAKLCTARANRGKKGFTLAELLIVVAILAVLVAIAFPVFTSSLESARTATDDANFRAAKAVAGAAYLETAKGETGSSGSGPAGYFNATEAKFETEKTNAYVKQGTAGVTGGSKGQVIKGDGKGGVSWTAK